MRRGVFVLLFLILLTACGSSKSGLTVDDLAIVKVDDQKAVIKYGMSRADSEKVLGKGEKMTIGDSFTYNSGVRIMYRNDKVAGISLTDESADAYETVSGLKIGMLKDEIKEVYGDQHQGDYEKT